MAFLDLPSRSIRFVLCEKLSLLPVQSLMVAVVGISKFMLPVEVWQGLAREHGGINLSDRADGVAGAGGGKISCVDGAAVDGPVEGHGAGEQGDVLANRANPRQESRVRREDPYSIARLRVSRRCSRAWRKSAGPTYSRMNGASGVRRAASLTNWR